MQKNLKPELDKTSEGKINKQETQKRNQKY